MVITIKNIFVGSLPWETDDQKLADLFAQFGKVIRAKVVRDRETNRSRGFGFVEMEDDASADEAIKQLNGADYEGRTLVVNEARPKQ